MVLSIRELSTLLYYRREPDYVPGLASELTLSRYKVASPGNPESPLAQHENGLLSDMMRILAELKGKHRSDAFNKRLLGRSVALVEAIGHRMAYEAAQRAGVDPHILKLYEADAMLRDMSWYSERGLSTKEKTLNVEEEMLTLLYENLDQLLEHTGVKPYIFAPIVTDDSWKRFVAILPTLQGNAYVNIQDPVANIRARL